MESGAPKLPPARDADGSERRHLRGGDHRRVDGVAGAWLARQAPERRPARVGSHCLLVEAIVNRRHVRVRAVRGWREPVAELAERSRREKPALIVVSSQPPCERCERAEAAVRIRAALDTLPGRYRQALHLVYVDGRTHDEVATHLAVPLGTAKAWVRRGLRALSAAHASLGATPTPGVTTASRMLVGLRLESRRSETIIRQVTPTAG